MPGAVAAKVFRNLVHKRISISRLAAQMAPRESLLDVTSLRLKYLDQRRDTEDPRQLVSFGTSGHRGSPLNGSFTAGEPILDKITRAPGNVASIGGSKAGKADGWFAAKPSLHGEPLQDLQRKLQRRITLGRTGE